MPVPQLSPEEILEQAYRIYSQDKARFGNIGAPVYPGKTTSPMSTLTQTARAHQERFANKRAPYANKLNTVLNRSNEALSPQQSQQILNMIRQGQLGANENIGLNTLRNTFGGAFTPEREASYRARTGQEVNRGLNEFGGRLNTLNRAASNLEGTRNLEIGQTLKALQADKQARRNALIGNLEQFGNQQHAHTNKMLAGEKGKFLQEAEEPRRKLEQLHMALEPHRQRIAAGQIHPDLENSMVQDISRALQNYGVNTSAPVGEWATNRTPSIPYSARTVAPLTPEMQSSYNLLERIHPSLKDTYSQQRKGITRGLLENETTAGRALQNLPGSLQGPLEQLDEDAKRRIQKDLAQIGNRYIKLGQHGSPQHLKTAESRAEDINRATLGERNKLFEENLRNQIALQHESEIGNLKKLNLIGSLGHREFNDVIGNIRNLNKLGSTKWRNEQDELEDIYNNYLNEQNFDNGVKQLRKLQHDIFGNKQAIGLQLDELNNLRSKYSEVEKDRNNLMQDIDSLTKFHTERQAAAEHLRRVHEQRRREQEAWEAQVRQQEEARRQRYAAEEAARIQREQQAAQEYARQQAAQRQALEAQRAQQAAQQAAQKPQLDQHALNAALRRQAMDNIMMHNMATQQNHGVYNPPPYDIGASIRNHQNDMQFYRNMGMPNNPNIYGYGR